MELENGLHGDGDVNSGICIASLWIGGCKHNQWLLTNSEMQVRETSELSLMSGTAGRRVGGEKFTTVLIYLTSEMKLSLYFSLICLSVWKG